MRGRMRERNEEPCYGFQSIATKLEPPEMTYYVHCNFEKIKIARLLVITSTKTKNVNCPKKANGEFSPHFD